MARIETLNLKGLRETAWGLADFKPTTSPEAVARMNNFLRLAAREVAKDVPFLFDEAILYTSVLPDIEMVEGDTLEATTDPWVLKSTAVVSADTTPWQEDASWDGRAIHLLDPADDGTWHLYTIREAWTASNGFRYLSLDRPWPNDGDTDIEWRVYQHPLRLPHNVVEVKAMHLLRDEGDSPIRVVTQGAAEYATLVRPHVLSVTGTPQRAFRRPMERLAAPAFTPVVQLTDNVAWDTVSSPIGRFEYVITYCVGKREVWALNGTPSRQTSVFPYPDTLAATQRAFEPFLESPPSALSSGITVPDATNSVLISLPDVDHMQGFGNVATERYRRCGIKKRIYRRRLTDGSASATWEARNRFYLLAEVDGHVTSFNDTGTVIPEWGVPLGDNHGFEMVALYPATDTRADVRLRVVLEPPNMEADTDAPTLPEAVVLPLIYRALAFMYESMGNGTMKMSALGDYRNGIEQIKKRRGDLRPGSVPRRRRVAGAYGRSRSGWSHLLPGDSAV